MDNLEERIKNFILRKIEDMTQERGVTQEKIKENSALINSGLLNSLEFLELLAVIETEFALEVDFSELDPTEFTTPKGLAFHTAQSASNVHE
ncbi:phosphopantetheine-binding protein [Deltaproteobacteria bacterium TL4]